MANRMKLDYRRADVVIAGGGVVGAAAAIASARAGADTLVVERYGFLGPTGEQNLPGCRSIQLAFDKSASV
jgi:glycine/D-amino acid oxidase-like deaminating enzyme